MNDVIICYDLSPLNPFVYCVLFYGVYISPKQQLTTALERQSNKINRKHK